MKTLFTSLCLLSWCATHAQLYINGDVTVQQGGTLYAQELVKLDAAGSLNLNGTLQSTVDVQTTQSFINTGNNGKVIFPIVSGVNKSINIGSGSISSITINHQNGTTVPFSLAVKSGLYLNPVSKTGLQTTNSVNKTWEVSPLSAAANTKISLGWEPSDELSGFSRTNASLFSWKEGSNTTWTWNSSSNAVTTGTLPQYQQNGIGSNLDSGKYHFGVGGNGTALPVNLIWVKGKSVCAFTDDITWYIGSAYNSAGFGIEWQNPETGSIETVGYVSTPATIANARQFKYIHTYSEKAKNEVYYRIRHDDIDNTSTYSEWIAIKIEHVENNHDVVPNPSNGEFNITNIQNANIRIINQFGVQVYQILNYTSDETINLTDVIEAGFYTAIIQYIDSGKTTSKKIIIE